MLKEGTSYKFQQVQNDTMRNDSDLINTLVCLDYNHLEPVPLVLDIHGYSGNALGQMSKFHIQWYHIIS